MEIPMKKLLLPVTAALLSLASTAFAAEFQPMGALGFGGAGVARTTNARAGYWNPAGLAFYERDFSMPIEVGVSLRVSKGLADNVDKVSKFTEKDSLGNSAFDNLKNLGVGPNPTALGDVVSLLSVLKDIETQKGTLSLTGTTVIAMQFKHFAFGAFGSLEGFAKPDIDTTNVLPSVISGGGAVDKAGFAAAAAGAATSNAFFTDATVRANVLGALTNAYGGDLASATNILNNLDSRLSQTSGGGSSIPAITQSQAADTIINTLIPALNGSGSSIDNNRTAVVMKSLAYVEYPISFGYPISLGKYGKLGVGASIKPIMGRVYSSELLLVKNGNNVDSGNITDNLTKNFKESNSITFDLGAFYKYGEWLNVGLVAKNLTSPKFDSPELKDQNGTLVTTDAKGKPISAAERVTLKPQVRAGISLDPLSWLTIAADLDITNNETVLSGLDYRSRNLGGGIELHPLTWLKLRLGMYKNLSNDEVGPVATTGLTFGTKWLNMDLDGAYGLESAKYKEHNYPKEAKLQAALNIQF
jgi:hypothetical protein